MNIYCSLSLKFLSPLRFLLLSILFLFVTKECLKEFRYCAYGFGCSKIVNFCCTKAGLTWKSSEFCQQSIGCIRLILGTFQDVVQQNQSFWSTYSPTWPLTKSCMEAGTLHKNSKGPLQKRHSLDSSYLCTYLMSIESPKSLKASLKYCQAQFHLAIQVQFHLNWD